MQEQLENFYNECVKELSTIGINIKNNEQIGEIDIKIAKRNSKRYGCCKQEQPDKNSAYKIKRGRHIITKYNRYEKHHIEISKWVMQLNEDIIKNTIMHEIIHCFPNCSNHGKTFKQYACYINEKLGYNVSRLGNKEEDCKKSNLQYKEIENEPKYKIVCQKCGHIYFRQRMKKNFTKCYVCGICKGRLEIKTN